MVTAPDERALREHLRGGRFLAGVAAGRWRLICVDWPTSSSRCRPRPAEQQPDRVRAPVRADRLPRHAAPTGGLWDLAADISLPAERRPKGERVGAAVPHRRLGWRRHRHVRAMGPDGPAGSHRLGAELPAAGMEPDAAT